MLFIHRYYIINGTIVLSILLSLAAAYFGYRKMRNGPFLIFTFYYAALFLTEAGSDLYSIVTRQSNHFIYNTYLFFTIGLHYLSFKYALKSKRLNQLNLYISVFVFFFTWVNLLFIQGSSVYNTYSHYLATYFFMLVALFYFYDVLRSEAIVYPLREYFFWFISGILISNMFSVAYYLFFLDILSKNIDPDGVIYEYINLISRLIEVGFSIFAFVSAPRWKKIS